MYYGKSHPLHPKPSTSVHHLEKVLVRLTPEPVQPGDLEVAPEMTHVVRLILHRLRVDVGEQSTTGFRLQNLLGQGWLVTWVVRGDRLGILRGRLDEHLPQPLGGEVVDPLIGRRVPEDVGHGFSELLNGDGETICLVGARHLDERVAVTNMSSAIDLRHLQKTY